MPLTNERLPYFPIAEILRQVEDALAQHEPGEIDWLTFVGSGEPTLHNGLGELIHGVKEMSDLPVAVITNGSLLYRRQVRQSLLPADAVLPSLDAGSAELYRRINRPHPQTTFARLVSGLTAFRRQYTGSLWIEVMLVHGLNDSDQALHEIAEVLRRIQPDEVHINLPTRPPAETWVRPADEEALVRALVIFSDVARVVHPAEGVFDLDGSGSVMEAVLGIISRHPMSQDELEKALAHWAPDEVDAILADLAESGRAQVVERLGTRFWSADLSHYPDEAHSLAASPGKISARRPCDPEKD